MISANTESTPHVAKANKIENTATTTIKFEESALEGRLTLFRNSSMDSLIYVIMVIAIFVLNQDHKGPRSAAREERLELPTPGFGDQCSTN